MGLGYVKSRGGPLGPPRFGPSLRTALGPPNHSNKAADGTKAIRGEAEQPKTNRRHRP